MAKLTKDFFEDREGAEPVRINKYLSDAGICSRREADRLIEEGKVWIDGVAAELGSRVHPGQKVTLRGKEVEMEEKLVLIAFHKPKGIVCTTASEEPDNIVDFIHYESRIFPIGRLDKDSEGLILLTNDGELMNRILKAKNFHEKEYLVKVNQPITQEFLRGMASGVPILDTVTRPCLIEALDRNCFRIVLTQGLNRQIRRMCEYFGYRVLSLKRIRILNIRLGKLKAGGYRNLTEEELDELKDLVQETEDAPLEEWSEGAVPQEGIVISNGNFWNTQIAVREKGRSQNKNDREQRKDGRNRARNAREDKRKAYGQDFGESNYAIYGSRKRKDRKRRFYGMDQDEVKNGKAGGEEPEKEIHGKLDGISKKQKNEEYKKFAGKKPWEDKYNKFGGRQGGKGWDANNSRTGKNFRGQTRGR